MAPIVQFHSTSKSYALPGRATLPVLERLALEIEEGEKVAIIGPNGSGKSTLLKLLSGEETPDSGSVLLHDLTEPGAIAYVPQDYRSALLPWFSVRRNLLLSESPNENGARVDQPVGAMLPAFLDLCAKIGLKLDLQKRPYQLSGGEQQLLLLLRALLSMPRLLLLDEALSAVDPARRRLLHDYLGEWFSKAPMTVILTSHDWTEAVLLSDRIILLGSDHGSRSITVPLAWPRSGALRDTAAFRAVIDQLVQDTP